MTYAPTGPFVNNVTPPSLSATYNNNIENWIASIDSKAPVAVTGSVSGTATLYQSQTGGTPKRVLVYWTNYKSATAQSLALPVAFTSGAWVQVGETQGQTIEFLSSGTAQTMSVLNTISSAGGSQNALTVIKSFSFAQVRSGFDTIRLTFTTTAAGGFALIDGI